MSTEHDNHGRTPANWTGATIITIAFIVGTLGVVIARPIVVGLGVLLIVVGLVVWKTMAGMEPSSELEASPETEASPVMESSPVMEVSPDAG